MSKKTIMLVISSFFLVGLLVLGYWVISNKSRDWTFENYETECLSQPLAIIPSPMPQDKPYAQSFNHLAYKMPSWWKSEVVNKGDLRYSKAAFYKKILVDGNNIWLTYFSYDTQIARYNTETGTVTYYSILDNVGMPFNVIDIYLANDGTLWIALSSTQPNGGYSALAHYRRETDSFEIILDQNRLFINSQETTSDPPDKYLGELSNGRMVVLMGQKIYLYDPVTNLAEILLGNEKVESVVVGENDEIWFVNILDDYNLRKVDAGTGQIINYGIPPSLGKHIETQPELNTASKAIAVDLQGSAWVSYFDRLELGEDGKYTWYSLHLPTVFVNSFDPSYIYRWASVFSTNIFSDGNIWFASDIGIVKYNVANDSWCLSAVVKTFTNYPIAEDAGGNIWTIVDRQIYKLEP